MSVNGGCDEEEDVMDFLKILMFCVIFSFYSSRILAGSAK